MLVMLCYHLLSHQEYIVDGMNYMRVKFFVDGSKRKGTVLMDLKKVQNYVQWWTVKFLKLVWSKKLI